MSADAEDGGRSCAQAHARGRQKGAQAGETPGRGHHGVSAAAAAVLLFALFPSDIIF